MEQGKLHHDLLTALRLLDEQLPEWVDGKTAWHMLNPCPTCYIARWNFWGILRDKLPFAKTPSKQKALAAWIWQQKEWADKAGKKFPPIVLITRRPYVPAPTTARI